MVECPVCLRDIELSLEAKEGDVIQCPYCKVWLRLAKAGEEWVAEEV